MTPAALADRIAALDWSGVSLQHQLAVVAACETLRNSSVAEVLQAAEQIELENDSPAASGALRVVHDDMRNGCRDSHVCDNVVPWRNETAQVTLLRAPSAELLRGAEYSERRVTLRRLDGSTVATALLSRPERWDWIVETVVEQCGCAPEQVGMVDDTVTVAGLPVFNC